MVYHWKSNYLKNYGRGDIIVEANSVDEAREKVINAFDTWRTLDYDELPDSFNYYIIEDEEYAQEKREELLEDISSEPEVVEILMISGSE